MSLLGFFDHVRFAIGFLSDLDLFLELIDKNMASAVHRASHFRDVRSNRIAAVVTRASFIEIIADREIAFAVADFQGDGRGQAIAFKDDGSIICTRFVASGGADEVLSTGWGRGNEDECEKSFSHLLSLVETPY